VTLLTISDTVLEEARAIRLLAMDIDGVLTNGEIIYTEDGQETKIFNVKDGHGIAMLVHVGFQVALITGRNSPINQRRVDELKIQHLYQGVKTKLPVLEKLLGELGFGLSEVLYMGDDTPDIPVLEAVGLAICPADAVDDVKRVCHYTTKASGGRGAVREVADLLLMVQHARRLERTGIGEIPQT
jgi:3-deoxy-D-manno-octulosonate 8-phosphate phosphatase (KDO 8-P phosphatase)